MKDRWEPEINGLVMELRAKLDEPGMTFRKASEITGRAPQTVKNWADRGGIPLNAENQAGLARLLGVSPRRIVELAGLSLSSKGMGGYLATAA